MMPRRLPAFAVPALLATGMLLSPHGQAGTDTLWGRICTTGDGATVTPPTWPAAARLPPAQCPQPPAGYSALPSIGTGGDVSANLAIGYDADTRRLCFVSTGLPMAPVLRVGVGHTLTLQISNTLRDTHPPQRGNVNCAIDSFGGEGLCLPKPVFAEKPGPNGAFYPMMANEAHSADGTSNLHVHGLFVSPQTCSDEVLNTVIYPANWRGRITPAPPCQSAPDILTYTYKLPADHPAGLYWYHTHRHGQSEHQTQMGLAGAIVVEDSGDAWRQSIGVTDDVLLVTDTPNTACLVGPNCDLPAAFAGTRRQDHAELARAAARLAPAAAERTRPALDPRIDQLDQAGECAYGASGDAGGTELWTLLLNGAPVPESPGGFPPDSELLSKTMQPGQRQIFRMVNASANSYLAPQLVLSQNGVQTVLPLEVFARDGVGLADATGRRRFGYFDVAKYPLIMPPSSRLEFVVHAPPAGAELYVQSAQVFPGCGGNAYPARRLLLVTSAGTPVDPGESNDHDLLEHTPSLAPYLSTLGTTATVHRTFVLSEYSRQFTYGLTDWPKATPTTADYGPSQTDFFITQVASDDGEVDPARTAITPFSMHTGTPQVVVHLHGRQSVTEEWLIENSTLEIHAFHIHQIHFRDITDPDQAADAQPIEDVINVPAAPLVGDVATGHPGRPGAVRLLLTFTQANIGEFVYHCHILEHEDNGMMGKIEVVAD